MSSIIVSIGYRAGSTCTVQEFASWFSGFEPPSWPGHRCDPDAVDTLLEVCGPDVGTVHTPRESLVAGDVGFVFVGARGDTMMCYAAARLSIHRSSIVIDLFGVHESVRGIGLGRVLHDRIMDVLGRAAIVYGMRAPVFSLQSTFDRTSYLEALVRLLFRCNDRSSTVDGHSAVFAVDGRALSKGVTGGSCGFWRRMGFDRSEIVFSNGALPLVRPLLMMWKQ